MSGRLLSIPADVHCLSPLDTHLTYMVNSLTKYLMTNLPTLEEAQMRQGGTVYDSQDVAA